MPDYTEKELEELKQEKKTKYASDKSDDFAYNLNSTQRKDLGAIAWSEQNELQKSVDQFEKDYNTHEKISLPALDKAIKDFLANPTSRELHAKAKNLQIKFIEETNRLQEKQIALSTSAKEKEFLPLAVSDFLANYNRLDQLRTSFKSLGTDILYTTLQIAQVAGVGTPTAQASSAVARQLTPAQRNQLLEKETGIITLAERMQKETESFQRPIKVEEIKTIKDLGRWVAGSSVNLIPSLTMAFTGPAALPLFGLSGAGSAGIDIAIRQKNAVERMIANQKLLAEGVSEEQRIEIESQIKKDKEILNLSNREQISIQGLYALSEIIFERLGTLSLLKGVKSALKSLPPVTIKEGFEFAGKQFTKGFTKEGGSEFATTVTQNFGDIFILGEDKNLFEGGLESFAQGALMGVGITGAPVAKAVNEAISMSLATRSEYNRMKEITQKLRELTGITSLENAPDSDIKMPTKNPEVQELIEELTGEMSAIKFNIVARLGKDISIEQAYEIGELNREMRKINDRFSKLSFNTDLSPAELDAAKKELEARYDNLIERREDILTDKDLQEETRALADATAVKFDSSLGYQMYEARMLNNSELNLLDQYDALSKRSKQALYNQAKKDLRKDAAPYARLTEKQIKDQAYKNYIDNAYKERIEKGEANAKSYAKSNGLDVNFVKTETVEQTIQALKDAGATQADITKAKKALEDGELEAMQEGNTVIVHMPNAIKNKRIGVFAHELLHIQAKIKYGADNVTQAGKDLLAYLKRNDKDLHARVKFRIDQSYREQNPEGEIVENENYYEEAMNAMSDVIADGQFIKANSLNAIRKFVNNYLPTKFKFKETEGEGVFNFVKDFNKSAHYGKAPVKLENVLNKVVSKATGTKFSKTNAAAIDKAYKDGEGAFQIAMMYEPLVNKLSQKYKNVPDFSVLKEDLVQNALYQKGGVIDLINSFDGRGTLSGYVGRLLPLRMNAFASDLFGQKFTDDVTERVDVAAQETLPEQVEREEIQEQELEVAKTQEKRNILDRANLSNELQVKALEAATKTLGTMLPQIDIKKGKNFREKYKIAVRNILYEDVSNELRAFNNREYYDYIKSNAKALYEIMPLEDLTKSQALKNLFLEQQFDKDGKPVRVLESFTGKKSYAGNLVFKKKPWAEVEKAFISEFAVKHSNHAQRKAFVINTLAKEIAFDESMQALNNPATLEKIPLTQETEINEFIQEFEMNIQRGRFTKYSITLQRKIDSDPSLQEIIKAGMPEVIKLYKSGKLLGNAFEEAIAPEEGLKFSITNIKSIKNELNSYDIKNRKVVEPEYNVQHIENEFGFESGQLATNAIQKATKKQNKDYLFNAEERSTIRSIIEEMGEDSALKELWAANAGGINHYAKLIYPDETLSSAQKNRFNQDTNSTPYKKSLRLENTQNPNQGYKKIGINEAKRQDEGVNYGISLLNSSLKELKVAELNLKKTINKNPLNEAGQEASRKLGLLNKLTGLVFAASSHGATQGNIKATATTIATNIPQNINLGFYLEHQPATSVFEKEYLIPFLAKYKAATEKNYKEVIDNFSKETKDNNTAVALTHFWKYVFEAASVKAAEGSLIDRINEVSIVEGVQRATKEYNQNLRNENKLKELEKGYNEILKIKKDFDNLPVTEQSYKKYLQKLKNNNYTKSNNASIDRLYKTFIIDKGDILATTKAGLRRKLNERVATVKKSFETEKYIREYSQNSLDYIKNNIEGKSITDIKNLFASEIILRDDLNIDAESLILKQSQNKANDNLKLSTTKRAQAKSKLIKDMIDRKSTRAQSVKSGKDLAIAERLGEKANAYNRGIFGQLSIPYNAEDWQGLLYNLAGKGEQGTADLKLLKELLIDPYTTGVSQLETERLETMNAFKQLKKKLRASPQRLTKKLDEIGLPMFTVQDAIRVYAFQNSGHDIPKLSKANLNKLVKFIEGNPDLRSFAFGLTRAVGKKGYIKPQSNWQRGNIGIDLANSISEVKRPKALAAWTKNLEIILNPTNRAKLTAAFGSDFIDTLDKTIARMKSGTNRKPSGDKTVDMYQDFINGSVGTIMFFNMRSATLQTISAVNFINWTDNNPLAASKAFLNAPQFAKDFKRLFYSDYLVSRRKGLKINIQESELMDAVTKSKNPILAATSYLLRIGFTPTQAADSLAISFGGAPFFRNRINSYIKSGLTKEKAEEKAYQDWRQISNESQQSSDPSRISEIQATNLGRLIFAFGNTPFQYTRIGKRALQDLINRRGDPVTNVSKVVYYLAAQNYMFNALQNAILAAMFDDEELTESQKKFKTAKYTRMYNNMANSVLRGTGMTGAVLAAVKDAGLKYYQLKNKENQFFADYGEISDALLSISPPLSHKQRKAEAAAEAGKYDSKFPPALVGAAEAAALVNIPLDRLLRKTENILGALNSDYDNWVRIAMFLGWSEYELLPQTPKTVGGPSSILSLPSESKVLPSKTKVKPSSN